jgi:HK97 gp10 family phage protein
MKITLKGLPELNKKLEKATNMTEYGKSLRLGCLLVKTDAKNRLLNGHSVTGRLARSISTKVEAMTKKSVKGIVFSNVEYAPYEEFGTGVRGKSSYDPSLPSTPEGISFSQKLGRPAHPFLRPALRDKTPQINDLLKPYR